jgi:hypothetical protein
MIYISKDNFVWLDVSEKYETQEEWKALMDLHELFAVDDQDVDHLIESPNQIPDVLRYYGRVCIEVGHWPQDRIIVEEPEID